MFSEKSLQYCLKNSVTLYTVLYLHASCAWYVYALSNNCDVWLRNVNLEAERVPSMIFVIIFNFLLSNYLCFACQITVVPFDVISLWPYIGLLLDLYKARH